MIWYARENPIHGSINHESVNRTVQNTEPTANQGKTGQSTDTSPGQRHRAHAACLLSSSCRGDDEHEISLSLSLSSFHLLIHPNPRIHCDEQLRKRRRRRRRSPGRGPRPARFRHGGGGGFVLLLAVGGADGGGVRGAVPVARLPDLLHPGFQVFCLDSCLVPNEGHDETVTINITVFGLSCIFPLEYKACIWDFVRLYSHQAEEAYALFDHF